MTMYNDQKALGAFEEVLEYIQGYYKREQLKDTITQVREALLNAIPQVIALEALVEFEMAENEDWYVGALSQKTKSIIRKRLGSYDA